MKFVNPDFDPATSEPPAFASKAAEKCKLQDCQGTRMRMNHSSGNSSHRHPLPPRPPPRPRLLFLLLLLPPPLPMGGASSSSQQSSSYLPQPRFSCPSFVLWPRCPTPCCPCGAATQICNNKFEITHPTRDNYRLRRQLVDTVLLNWKY